MSNTQAIRRRIKSVKSVRQITKAMELTAAAKMHRAIQMVLDTRPYANRALAIARNLESKGSGSHPLLSPRTIHKELVIVITSDSGLAGGFNNQLLRMVATWHKTKSDAPQYIAVGKKSGTMLHRLGYEIAASFVDLAQPPTIESIRPISLLAQQQFLAAQIDCVWIAYNHYHSTLTQTPTMLQLLPFQLFEPDNSENKEENMITEAVFEPNAEVLLDAVLPRLVDHVLLQIMIESTASEHAARMMAMRNASDNASDVIDDLQLTFNGIRQASITAEIAEISASMAALL